MDEVMGVEPTSSVWQTEVLTVELHLDGGQDRSRICNLTITNRVHCQLCYLAILEKGKEFGEQFQSHASSMELHNLEYAQRTEVLVRRSWSSECSIGEAGIVFT